MSANPVLLDKASSTHSGSVRRRLRVGLRYARGNKVIVAGGTILGLAAIAAVFGPALAPYGLHEQVGPVYGEPSWAHPLGLDDGGIDMVTLLLYGARTSMLVGVSAALVAMLVGGTVGLLAGYRGGGIDVLLMRITDYFIVVPAIPLMIAVAAVWGASLSHIILVIGLLSWPRTARLVRAQAKTLRERGYVKRVRSLGGGHVRTLCHHVLPHLAPLLIASTVLTVADAVFAEAALAFLGLGSPTDPSWGTQIANAFDRTAISAGAWWAIVPPGLCITLVVIACSAIGLGLEDALNPRLKASPLSRATFRLRPNKEEEA